MDPRRFFSTYHWWGKCIGGCLGYLIFGPAGALFGLLIGNLFDRGLTYHFTAPYWQFHTIKRSAIQKVFFESTFLIMGNIAKADGHVTSQEIKKAIALMEELRLSSKQKEQAKELFGLGKKSSFDLWTALEPLREALKYNPELVKIFLDIQFQMATVDGITLKKQQIFNTILNYFGFAPLEEQHRFYEDFARKSDYQQHSYQNNNRYEGESYSSRTRSHSELEHAYSILGITATASKQEVKRAYRKLVSSNHPDKLIAKGLPAEMIKVATEKTQKIRKAYEKICAEKKW